MESGYRVFLAMYGLPGLFLLSLFFVALVYQSIKGMLQTRDDPDYVMICICLFFAGSAVAISCFASNTFDEYQSIPFLMLLSGLLHKSKWCSLPVSHSSEIKKI
jgi:O-antigen ligase